MLHASAPSPNTASLVPCHEGEGLSSCPLRRRLDAEGRTRGRCVCLRSPASFCPSERARRRVDEFLPVTRSCRERLYGIFTGGLSGIMCIWRSKDVTCQAVSSRNREYFLRPLCSGHRSRHGDSAVNRTKSLPSGSLRFCWRKQMTSSCKMQPAEVPRGTK